MTNDHRDACYLVAVAADGLVLARRVPATALTLDDGGTCCLGYLGDDTPSTVAAAQTALAQVVASDRAQRPRGRVARS